MVLVDFDETISTIETTPLLGQFGLDTNNNTLPWQYFIDTYMEDYNRIEASLPETIQPEDRIKRFREAEEASLTRLNEHHVFQGLTRQQIFDKATDMAGEILKKNALLTLKSASRSNRLRVISLNWSKDWIRGFLAPLELSYEQIYCNDLVYDRKGKATGEIKMDVLTSYDKKVLMKRIKKHLRKGTPIIYIGDSGGDVLPLVNADAGIVIGNRSSLLRSLKEDFNRTVIENTLPALKKQPTIYRVDNWDQIKDSKILLPPHHYKTKP
ncbi:HAD-like domain-containing protein [Phascolomyces articulosus]|uniref:HAD-like domain-containing protein n=1 Tax=Phascolomyces articulosus TaxID=60185 RepID=A0AAD5K6U6_9FUNG|nr:HAD-like domain-containing protein [Phascolomyces articulosus]